MKPVHPFFGITPEAIKAININVTPAKSFSMIDSEMSVAAERQCIVTLELIGIDDRTPSDRLDR